MSDAAPFEQSASFVHGNRGLRFRLVSEPADRRRFCGTVVFVPAFAEEMNKSRRMAARMARLLAARGWRVVQRDLAGCGDSAGEFVAASWSDWTDDVAAELGDADPQRPVWLWCMRAGALFSAAALAVRPGTNLLLWQPVLSGAQHLRQFLRLHAGARIVGEARIAGAAPRRPTVGTDQAVEVGGYELNPGLAAAFEHATFDVPAAFTGRIVWLETAPDVRPSLSPASARVVEQLQRRGVEVTAAAVVGPPFWQTAEIEDCDLLLERTLAGLQGGAVAVQQGEVGRVRLDAEPGASRGAGRDDEQPVDEALAFEGSRGRLWGVLSTPPAGTVQSSTAVVIVVGGPQYRVGSHRQFVQMARRWAGAGFATLRFDYTGMGDSDGDLASFETCRQDLGAAIDALFAARPKLARIALWGLCDGASAALMFATGDARVAGIAAANPWVRSGTSLAATRVRHYYLDRVLQRQFWVKLLRGGVDWRASFGALATDLKEARSPRSPAVQDDSFQARMARGLAAFRGRALLILSGNDLTAKEFLFYAETSVAWRGLLADPKVSRIDVPEADHTFSKRGWLTDVEDQTLAWLRQFDQSAAGVAMSHGEVRSL